MATKIFQQAFLSFFQLIKLPTLNGSTEFRVKYDVPRKAIYVEVIIYIPLDTASWDKMKESED